MTFHYQFLFLLTASYLGRCYGLKNRLREHPILRPVVSMILWWIPFLLIAFSLSMLGCAAVITAAYAAWLYGNKKIPQKKNFDASRRRFFFREIFMAAVILTVSYFLTVTDHCLIPLPCVQAFFTTIGVSFETVLTWISGLILIDRPANDLVVHIIRPYAPRQPQSKKMLIETVTAGRLIGTLERLIMFVLFSIHSVSTIAFVLTAKSIARYDRISKDQGFAEYYLLGTLLSTGIVILIASWLLV